MTTNDMGAVALGCAFILMACVEAADAVNDVRNCDAKFVDIVGRLVVSFVLLALGVLVLREIYDVSA
jgi:hypothetical protein